MAMPRSDGAGTSGATPDAVRRIVAERIRIVPSAPWHAPHLEALQVTCFPTLGAQELMRAEHFLHHIALFPEADLVAEAATDPAGAPLAVPRVVGLGSGFFVDVDLTRPGHTFRGMIDDGWFGRHDPAGSWYYGADLSVHPDYRGLGLARRLYDARKEIVRRHGKRGIVAGGALPGYARHRGSLGVEAYVAAVVAGELFDPTLSVQLRNGFIVAGLLPGYMEDSAADDWATLLVWRAPEAES